MEKEKSNICEMCGYHVAVRQKAHILAEGKKSGENLLMLCPTCHIMFDTHLKPKIFRALKKFGIKLPESWETSIYEQAARASMEKKKIIEDNVAQLFDGKVKVLVVNYDTVKVGVLRHE